MASSSRNQDLLELLSCAFCVEPMYPPIFQCPNGHTLCAECKSSIHKLCPKCQVRMGDINIRALALEKLAMYLEHPCRYQGLGCVEMLQYDSKKEHEQQCKFRAYNCPYLCSRCEISGDIPKLLLLLKDDHCCCTYNSAKINVPWIHSDPTDGNAVSWNLDVFDCLGAHFCLYLEAFHCPQDLVYLAFLMFMGDESEASKYCYRLEVGSETRKLVWEGKPMSIRGRKDQIIKSLDGLAIHQGVAMSFNEYASMDSLKLRLKCLIWKQHL